MRKKPTFSKRHYDLIASVVQKLTLGEPDQCQRMARAFAKALIGTNPNFDAERFERACWEDAPPRPCAGNSPGPAILSAVPRTMADTLG